MELMTMLSAEPECQMPSSRWPRVEMIMGAFCPPRVRYCKCGQVVADDLQAIEQVIEILDLRDGPEAAHGQANALPDDGGFTDTGIGNPHLAVFCLQAFQCLVHPANLADIFPENQCFRVVPEDIIEIVPQNLPARGHQ